MQIGTRLRGRLDVLLGRHGRVVALEQVVQVLQKGLLLNRTEAPYAAQQHRLQHFGPLRVQQHRLAHWAHKHHQKARHRCQPKGRARALKFGHHRAARPVHDFSKAGRAGGLRALKVDVSVRQALGEAFVRQRADGGYRFAVTALQGVRRRGAGRTHHLFDLAQRLRLVEFVARLERGGAFFAALSRDRVHLHLHRGLESGTQGVVGRRARVGARIGVRVFDQPLARAFVRRPRRRWARRRTRRRKWDGARGCEARARSGGERSLRAGEDRDRPRGCLRVQHCVG